MFSIPAQREGLSLESQAGVSDLPRAGAESAHQTAQNVLCAKNLSRWPFPWRLTNCEDDGLDVDLSLKSGQSRSCFEKNSLKQFLSISGLPPPMVLSVLCLFFLKGVDAMSDEYSLSDVLDRIYHNQLALEAALMELILSVEK